MFYMNFNIIHFFLYIYIKEIMYYMKVNIKQCCII